MVTHKIQLINSYTIKGLGTVNRQVNTANQASTKYSATLDKQGKLLKLTERGVTNVAGVTARYSRVVKDNTSFVQNSLKSFTQFRWMLVNVAMAGALAYGAFRLLAKNAVELESELANVRKTTGFTKDEIAGLKEGLIDLSKALPLTVQELAKIAAIAGQLGLGEAGAKGIEGFTRTVALMATATEMTAETAANSLAKVSKAFNVPISQANRLGSAINELSNTTSATSTEIVGALTRIGAAGANLGVTAEFAIALSASLIEAGMRSERSGTRMKKVFMIMASKSEEIGKGLGIKNFANLVETDVESAFLTMLESLDKIESKVKREELAFKLFGSVGGIVISTLSSHYDGLIENIDNSNRAFDEGISLLKESIIQIETTKNQWTLLKNEIIATTLANDSYVNSLIRSMRKQVMASSLREERREEQYPDAGWGFGIMRGLESSLRTLSTAGGGIMGFMGGGPWGAAGGAVVGRGFAEAWLAGMRSITGMGVEAEIEFGLEGLKKELKGLFEEEDYQTIINLVEGLDDVEDKFATLTTAVGMATNEYDMMVGELGIVLDSLDEENEVLAKGSERWKDYTKKIREMELILGSNNPLTAEHRDLLKEIKDATDEANKSTEGFNVTLAMYNEEVEEILNKAKGIGLGSSGFYSMFKGAFTFGDEFDRMRTTLEDEIKSIERKGGTFEVTWGVKPSKVRELINTQEELYLAEEKNKEMQEELDAYIKKHTKSIDRYKDKIDDLNDTLDEYGDKLSEVKDKVRDANEVMSNIQSRRWEIRGIGETGVSHLIREQELELARARFSALGLGSAEEFLRNASVITTDAIDNQTEAVRRLIKATNEGNDEYEAWKTTLAETIKQLLLNSQDIERDVTEVVKKAQEEYMGLTSFKRKKEGTPYDAMEAQLEALGLAQEVFFGSEKEKLDYSEKKWEDAQTGLNTTAQSAISSLDLQRTALEELNKEEERWIVLQVEKRKQIDKTRAKLEEKEEKIEERKREEEKREEDKEKRKKKAEEEYGTKISRGSYSFQAEGSAEEDQIKDFLGIDPSGVSMDAYLRDRSHSFVKSWRDYWLDKFQGFYDANDLKSTVYQKYNQYGDFISRPGQPIQAFSPNDTVIGVKEGAGKTVGGTSIGNVSININGGSFNERTLALEIKRQIASLA